ncbi:MAG TPA: universal stress protein [Nitrospirales bacterium]|nr:universal stress protein [Nitrospirales bacterium]
MPNHRLRQPLIRSVVHCSDFSPGSHTAFAHALKAALTAKAKLSILHVADDMEANWTEFPGVRNILERWELLPRNSPRSAVPELGINVRKLTIQHKDPVKSVVEWLEHHPTDLLVLATQQDNNRVFWMSRSVAKPITRKSRLMTLLIPKGIMGFVSKQDGAVSLKHIVIPVAADPKPQPAIQAAARLVQQLNCPSGRFTVLHVGENGQMPTVRFSSVPGWSWTKVTEDGDISKIILKTVKDHKADLLIMTTAGRRGFLDALRGSQTEQVLRKASCPVLTIPAGGWMASLLETETDGDT